MTKCKYIYIIQNINDHMGNQIFLSRNVSVHLKTAEITSVSETENESQAH